MRKFSPGLEELGQSIKGQEERLQHHNYQGALHSHARGLLGHLTAFSLIQQLTSHTKQISLHIAQTLMWK